MIQPTYCSVKDCRRQIHPERVMCYTHWGLVSSEVKRRIALSRRGDPRWHYAVSDAINEVSAKEKPQAPAARESGKDRQYRDDNE